MARRKDQFGAGGLPMTPSRVSDKATPSAVGIRLGLPPGWVKFDPKDREDLGSTLNAIESVLAPLGEAGLLPACVRLPEIAEQVSETSRVMVGGNVLLAAGWASPVHVDGKLTCLLYTSRCV